MSFDDLCASLVQNHHLSHDQIRRLTPYQVRNHYGKDLLKEKEIDADVFWDASPQKLFQDAWTSRGYTATFPAAKWLEELKSPRYTTPEKGSRVKDKWSGAEYMS